VGDRLTRWAPVVAYMGLIFYQSAQPAVPRAVEFVWDKLLHGGGYALLALLCVRALTDRFRRPTTAGLALSAWVITTLYGVTDEWHQSFVPPREMDPRDLVADAVGAAVVVVACLMWSSRRRRQL